MHVAVLTHILPVLPHHKTNLYDENGELTFTSWLLISGRQNRQYTAT